MKNRRETARSFGESSFTGFLTFILKSSVFWSYFDRFKKYFRRFRLIRFIFVVITYIVTFLGTGVALIVTTAVFLVVLPIVALIGFAVVFVSLLQRKKACLKMKELLSERTVFVFFPSRDADFSHDSFLAGQCREIAGNGGAAVVVTPYFLTSEGLGGKGPYFTVRCEAENIYIVRQYIFFALRRRVLSESVKQCVYFY